MLVAPLQAINVQQFIDENRATWERDGVLRRRVWENSEYITVLHRGPTSARQFHVNQGEEIFYQLEGELHFHYVEADGSHQLLVARPGDCFLLPANVPHSPRRPPGCWTLVVERQRRPEEADGWIWYCEQCQGKLYETSEHYGGPSDGNVGTVAPFVAAAQQALRELGACPRCGASIPVAGGG
jgi:3-hydroxyanthranilate 3,4-dioxygenase